MVKKLVNLILVVVMLLNLVLLFQPYWTYGEDEEVASIAGYVLLPKEHKELTKELKEITGERKPLTNVAFPLFLLILVNVLGAVVGLLLLKTRSAAIFSLASGLATVYAFMTDIIVKEQPLWVPCLILGVVTAVLGLVQLIVFDYYSEDDRHKIDPTPCVG